MKEVASVSGRDRALGALSEKADELRQAHTYRRFTSLSAVQSKYPVFETAAGARVVHMCLNDYLGYSQTDEAKIAAVEAIRSAGVGATGSRNIGGTRPLHEKLEAALCALHQTEDALLYSSGNTANTDIVAVLSRLLPKSVFYSDIENHASIIDPLRALPRARRHVVAHNNFEDLALRFQTHHVAENQPILIVESLYSMSGEWAPLENLCAWFRERGGLVLVNEVHAGAVRGPGGAGRLAELGCSNLCDAVIGSLSKGWGVSGGYIAGRSHIVDACRQTGVRAIFTTSTPEHVTAACLANIDKRHDDVVAPALLQQNLAHLHQCLDRRRIAYGGAALSHIVPISIDDEVACKAVAEALLANGYYATPVIYPTVPRGQSRLRVTVTPLHGGDQIEGFVDALAHALKKVGS